MSKFEHPEVFTLDEQEYVFEESSDKTKYLVLQLNDVVEQRVEKQMRLDQLHAAEIFYTEKLRGSLTETDPNDSPPEVPEVPEVPAEP